MSPPPLPTPLEHLGNRHFSFYPAILNIEHNEWLFRRATWSEILVVNTRSSQEIWIPRRFLGEVSRIDDPVLIVGLVKELEYKGGAVWPHQRRVFEMPLAVGESPRMPQPVNEAPAPVIGIRLEPGTERRMGRLVGITMACGLVGCVFVLSIYREGVLRPRIVYSTRDQSYLELNRGDDYYAVVRKLGTPSADRWRSETGELQYRALSYPQKGFIVILMGSDRKDAKYIGTLDENWNIVHSVDTHRGGTTAAMLRGLKRF